MLSSDKNVETIAELVEVLKHYLGLQTEYVKLDVIDKVVSLLTAAALSIVFFLMVIAILMFVWIAVGFWLASYMGPAWAFLCVAGIHVLLLAVLYLFKGAWLERPIVKFLAGLLMK